MANVTDAVILLKFEGPNFLLTVAEEREYFDRRELTGGDEIFRRVFRNLYISPNIRIFKSKRMR